MTNIIKILDVKERKNKINLKISLSISSVKDNISEHYRTKLPSLFCAMIDSNTWQG